MCRSSRIRRSTLADDVAVTKRMLAAQDGPAILVGHSYGGVVITEAGNDPKVAGLVYIAAFAPDKGESVSALLKNPPPGAPVPPILPPQDGYPVPRSREVPRLVRRGRQPGSGGVHGGFTGPVGCSAALDGAVTEPAWKSKPSWYLVSDGGQDDSARRAARDVEARWFNRGGGKGQSRGLRVPTEGGCRADCEGRQRRGLGDAVALRIDSCVTAGHVRQRAGCDLPSSGRHDGRHADLLQGLDGDHEKRNQDED